jgi:hypothetical protein
MQQGQLRRAILRGSTMERRKEGITRRPERRRRHDRSTGKRKFEPVLQAEIGGFWDDDLGMEDECQRIMESIRGEEANKGKNLGWNGGRMWVSCLSCGRMAVLVRQGWVGRKQEQAAKEKNGYAVSVCGSCERRNGEMLRRDGGSGMAIDNEMVRASKGFRAVRHVHNQSSSSGRLLLD